MRGEGHRGTVWRSARPARDGTASSTWPGRVSSEGGGRGRGRGSRTDPAAARRLRARACVRSGQRGERRGAGGREGTTEDGGAHVAVGAARRRWTRPRTRLDAPPSPSGPRNGPTPPLSCTCCAVVRRTSSSVQRLQGRMRGSSAAGRAEFYQMRKLAISIHT